jgi:hypothetical protein
MLSKKKLLLTFDYELFLGSRSGSVDNCIIIPTKKVLEILKLYKITGAIFFVDTTYLITLKNNDNKNCQDDFEKIEKQIKDMKDAGHYVFPHLHPHWLDAKYLPEINQWDLSDTKKYSFSALNKDEKRYSFSQSIKVLEDIIGHQNEWGYRAGGWCIQPFSDFKSFFKEYNVLYEFSVLKGYSCISDFQNFNFVKAPEKKIYKFNDDVLIEDNNGMFTEIPISNIKRSLSTKILNSIFIKFLYKKGITNYGDGLSTTSASVKESKSGNSEMASIELLTVINITDYIRKFEKMDFLHFISHPKMLNPHNLTCLEVFLKKVLSKHKLSTDFKEMIPNND